MKTPGVEGTFADHGPESVSPARTRRTAAVVFLPLKSFHERAAIRPMNRPAAIAGYLYGELAQIQEAFVCVFPPPPVQGMGQAGGFKMQVEDRSGVGDAAAIAGRRGAL